jgi:sulfur-oxidizing protein SoxY
MTTSKGVATVDRRSFVLSAAAVAAVLPWTHPAFAQAQDAAALEAALKKAIGDAKPIDGKILLDLPEIAENGNTVPFGATVESPMSATDYVKALHIFAPGNPQADVATFLFTPASGKASVASRMRLGRTQDVYAVAELSDGKVYMAKKTVKVTIGGCGG